MAGGAVGDTELSGMDRRRGLRAERVGEGAGAYGGQRIIFRSDVADLRVIPTSSGGSSCRRPFHGGIIFGKWVKGKRYLRRFPTHWRRGWHERLEDGECGVYAFGHRLRDRAAV
jgi:hypothetical protein